MSEDLPQGEIDQMFALASQTSRLESAAKLIVTHTRASRFAQAAANNPSISITQASDPAGLKQALVGNADRAGELEH